MFVSDTIHNAQYIHDLFFPHDDGPNLIKHNTSTWPQLIWWFDHSFRYSYSFYCILYYCPQFSPDLRYLELTAPKALGSSGDGLPLHPVKLLSCDQCKLLTPCTETFKSCSSNRKRKIFHRYLEALDPVLQQYSRSSEENLCQDVWLCSLPTSTTSNPCRADWPVNCCNTKSRAPIADTGSTPRGDVRCHFKKADLKIKPLF